MATHPVAIPSNGYLVMSEEWDMLHDLLGGTKAMRLAGEKWLPKEPGESFEKYEARLNRSVLYNAFSDTLNKLSNKPFSHPMTVTDLPKELEYLFLDMDSMGTNLEAFTAEVLYNLICYGVVHIFVDHSVVDVENPTKADEKAVGARVLFSVIEAPSLIGWQSKIEGGKNILTQIRVKQTKIESEGPYGDVVNNFIKVINTDSWELWKQNPKKKEEYISVEKGVMTFGQIPLVTLYADQTGYMTANPPLQDLAWMNIIHWQSYSDQRNILRFSRFALLFGKGMPREMTEMNDLEIGPTRSFFADDPNADMKYVEHTGSSIEAGAKDVEDIESKMEVLGNMPMTKSPKKLATSVRIDSDRNSSQLQSWIRDLERAIEEALKMACKWRAIEPPKELSVDIYSDFETAMLGSSDKDFILNARLAGEISSETFLKEIKRRGALADSVDVDEEIVRLSNEARAELENAIDNSE